MDLNLVEQLARYEVGGDAEEGAEEAADRGQAPGELGVISSIGVLDGGVDDGPYAKTDAGAYDGSCDHRSGRVAGADLLDAGSGERDRAIDSSLSPVTDQTVVVGGVERTENLLFVQRDPDGGAGLEGLYAVPVFRRLLRKPCCRSSEEQGKEEETVQQAGADWDYPLDQAHYNLPPRAGQALNWPVWVTGSIPGLSTPLVSLLLVSPSGTLCLSAVSCLPTLKPCFPNLSEFQLTLPCHSSLHRGSLVRTIGVFLLAGVGVCFASSPEGVGASEPKVVGPVEARVLVDSLPDAPIPNLVLMADVSGSSSSDEAEGDSAVKLIPSALMVIDPDAGSTKVTPADRVMAREQLNEGCETGRIRGKACKVHWLPILWQSFEWLTAQHSGNILLDWDTRHDLTANPFWATYVFSVEHYRWYQWSDDTPFIVHDIGHPMMGAIVSGIFEQNDPKGRALVFENNGNYWRSRLKAMAYSAVYSAQWKVGPVSEASIGNSGWATYYVPHLGRTTNETGFQDFVITPVYGFGWNVGEDAIDRYIMPKIHAHVKNRFYLTALFWMTPCKAAANVLRWKPTYYRDTAYAAPDAVRSDN